MSILVNARGSSNSTIVRFGRFYASSSYYAREYVSINNSYFLVPNSTTPRWRYTYGNGECDMVMIRAEIKEDAEGYIYGFKASGAEMSIQKFTDTDDNNKKKIKWTIGSNSRTVDWQAGVHVYGFLSNGVGFYDGTKLYKSGTPNGSLIDSGASGSSEQCIIIGGLVDGTANNAKDCIHMTGSSYCIDIYEVVLSAYNESATSRTLAHMYAASTDGGTTAYMYETRYQRGQTGMNSGKSYTGVTAGGATPNTTITYGVQLHDLKFVTGSGYRDLMALVCEDDDMPGHASTDAEPAYTLSGPDSQSYSSAFMLKGSDLNGSGDITMPIPTGWSHESPQQTRPNTDGRLGALISGRIPKWFLWSDNINVGKFAIDDGSKWEFLYNITNPRGGEGKLDLKFFEGLTNASTGHHDPIFDMGDNITIEYHNGLAFQCNDLTRISLDTVVSDYAVSPNDDIRVFKGVRSTMSNPAHMALGNMVDWFKTAAQQQSDSDTQSAHTKKWYMFFGLSGTIQRNYGNGATRKVAAAWEQTASSGSSVGLPLLPLSSGTTAAEIEKFRDGKSNGAWYEWGGDNGFSVCGSERDQDLIFYEILTSNGNAIEGEGKLDLIINSQVITATSIPESSLCDTTAIIPASKVVIAGNMNPKTSGSDVGSTNYRCILMNETAKIGNTTVYIYPLYAGMDKVKPGVQSMNYYGCATRVQDTVANNPVFQLIICCLNGQLTDNNARAQNLSGGMHLTAEFTTINGSNITRTLVDKDFTLGPNQVVNNTLKLHLKNGNGGHQTINDDEPENTHTASINFKKSEIAAHCTNYSEGWRLTENTTARIWVEPSGDINPKLKLHGFTYYLNEGAYKSDSPFYSSKYYTIIPKSDLFRMTSQNDAINMLLQCWDSTSPTPGVYTNFDISKLDNSSDTGTDKYGIAIRIYRTWDVENNNNLIPENLFCGFIIFMAASGDTSAPSGLKAHGLDGAAWTTPYSRNTNEHHEYHLTVSGGTINPIVVIQDVITSSSYTKWGSNNLLVSVTRMKGSDFYLTT